MDRKLRLWETSALVALSVTLLSAVWAQSSQTQREERVIRLHVIAADDTQAEQAVKLRVRDAVLDCLGERLDGTESAAETRARLSECLEDVALAAYAAGGGRSVTVRLGRTAYGARALGEGVLPAGSYESLRVILGEGAGHNWWGILYPQLCLPAAQGEQEAAVAALKREGILLLPEEEGTELRLYVLDCWTRWKTWLSGEEAA